MNPQLREEVSRLIGRCLFQGRKARNLSLGAAASLFGIGIDELIDLEDGIGTMDKRSVLQMAATYGVQLQTIEFIVTIVTAYNQARKEAVSKRHHLSIAGVQNSKPWEIEPESFDELVKTVRVLTKELAPIIFSNVDYGALKAALSNADTKLQDYVAHEFVDQTIQ